MLAVLSHEGAHAIMFGSWPIPVGAAHRDGYLARPDVSGKVPVVFVVPGLDGMGSFEKDMCRRLARVGIAALTLEIYDSEVPHDSYQATTDQEALDRIEELHQFLVSDAIEWAKSEHVGLLGVDVGGRFALIKAATREWVRSIALLYAPLTGDEDRGHQVADYLSHLPVPVLALYGADDELIASSSVDEAQRRNDHGQWLLYEGAGHGFADVTNDGFDQGSADDAFARLQAFFQATLPPAEIENLG